MEPVRFEVPAEDGATLPAGTRAAPAGAYRTAPEAVFPLLGRRFADLVPRPLCPAPGDLLLHPLASPPAEARRWALRALERRGCVLAERGAGGRAVPAAGASLPGWFQGLLSS